MGIFGDNKKTLVSSSAYNLSGAPEDFVDYKKTVIIGGILPAAKDPLGQTIPRSYLHGPGIRMRSFGRWARTSGYDAAIGLYTGQLYTGNSINLDVLATQIPVGAGETVVLQLAEIGTANYTNWAEQFVFANYPDQGETDWKADYDLNTGKIRITFEDGNWVDFIPADYSPEGRYLYATYMVTTGAQTGPLVPGIPVSLGSGDSFPSLAGWTQNSYTQWDHTATLSVVTNTVVTYSDSRPVESSTSTSSQEVNYEDFVGQWERTDYMGQATGDKLYSIRKVQDRNQEGSISQTSETTSSTEIITGGVTKSTTVTVVSDHLDIERGYRVDTQELILKSWSKPRTFIYRRGGGNAVLDAMFIPPQSAGTFFPFIPLRIDNRFVNELWPDTIYPKAKTALRRAIGTRLDKLLLKVANNDSIGDLDYAYVVFGASLNTRDNAAKRYIYEFFQEHMLGQGDTGSLYDSFKQQWAAARALAAAWGAWKSAQSAVGEGDGPERPPGYGEPEPPQPTYPVLPTYQVGVTSNSNIIMNYSMILAWTHVVEYSGSGKKKADAKQGDLWFEIVGQETFNLLLYTSGGDAEIGQMADYPGFTVQQVRLHWQETANSWRTLDLYGLTHINNVYQGLTVEITAFEALTDPEESGFIIPLHEDIFKAMPMVVGTQMATTCAHIVFNCYQVVKKKWYQTGAFKVFLVIVIIIISVFTGGAGAGSAGLLGTNVAVGTALGFVGVAAIVAGAIANAVAAMILMQVLQVASTAIFGEKLGIIVAVIASVVAMNVGSAYASGTSVSTSFGSLMNADSLMQLTGSLGNGYSQYLQYATQDVLQKTQSMMEAYAVESKKLSDLSLETFGQGGGVIDTMSLTDVERYNTNEAPETFLSRTLMTGPEIADLSMNMLSNFADLTLSTKLP